MQAEILLHYQFPRSSGRYACATVSEFRVRYDESIALAALNNAHQHSRAHLLGSFESWAEVPIAHLPFRT
jgi:hypothetical protein